MDSNDISTVSEHKHLGLVISNNGSWEKHIDMITPFRFAQSWIFVKSLFRESAVSFGSSTIRYKLVSSANSFIVDCISVTMSFIKIINKTGPSIEPWEQSFRQSLAYWITKNIRIDWNTGSFTIVDNKILVK
jgi:hypothetical protein